MRNFQRHGAWLWKWLCVFTWLVTYHYPRYYVLFFLSHLCLTPSLSFHAFSYFQEKMCIGVIELSLAIAFKYSSVYINRRHEIQRCRDFIQCRPRPQTELWWAELSVFALLNVNTVFTNIYTSSSSHILSYLFCSFLIASIRETNIDELELSAITKARPWKF